MPTMPGSDDRPNLCGPTITELRHGHRGGRARPHSSPTEAHPYIKTSHLQRFPRHRHRRLGRRLPPLPETRRRRRCVTTLVPTRHDAPQRAAISWLHGRRGTRSLVVAAKCERLPRSRGRASPRRRSAKRRPRRCRGSGTVALHLRCIGLVGVMAPVSTPWTSALPRVSKRCPLRASVQ